MTALDMSEDGRFLVAVGLDAHSKQLIVVWDVSGVRENKKSILVVKSVTEHNVKRVKFCAYEPEKFMTAGRDSVRLYRTKCGALRGLSIQVCCISLNPTVPFLHRPTPSQGDQFSKCVYEVPSVVVNTV